MCSAACNLTDLAPRLTHILKKRNPALANTKIETVSYAGWPNCYRLVNNDIELVVTTDVGPRIIRCGFVGGRNLFAELPGHLGKSGEPWWMFRGGHRLWIAPEVKPDTYALDNSPVKVTVDGDFLSLLQAVEPETSLQKEISIRIEDSGEILVTHRIENRGPQARRFAPWALSAMAPGGVGITTFPPRTSHDHHLQPTNPLVMWSYTDFTDPRWLFTSKYLVLRQDSTRHDPQKIGLFNQHTFAAYLLGTELFSKRSECRCGDSYPDFQSSLELFTNDQFLELETLGPLVDLKPDSSVSHLEHWFLHRNVQLAGFTDEELDRTLLPILESTAQAVKAV